MPVNVPLKKAVEITGLHPNTLRKYANRGDIPSYRLPNGDRRFDVSKFVQAKRSVVCYARVSQPKQKSDLDRQCEFLSVKYPGCEVVRDIASLVNAQTIRVPDVETRDYVIAEFSKLIKVDEHGAQD